MTRLQVRESSNAASVFRCPPKCDQVRSGRIACGGMHPASATGIGVNFELELAASPSPEPNIECAEPNAAAPYCQKRRSAGFCIWRRVSEHALV